MLVHCYPFVFSFVFLSIHPSILLFIHLFIVSHLFTHLTIHSSVIYSFISTFICLEFIHAVSQSIILSSIHPNYYFSYLSFYPLFFSHFSSIRPTYSSINSLFFHPFIFPLIHTFSYPRLSFTYDIIEMLFHLKIVNIQNPFFILLFWSLICMLFVFNSYVFFIPDLPLYNWNAFSLENY